MVIFLIVSALVSMVATGAIVFIGLAKPEQRTSLQTKAEVVPTPTTSPTPKSISPTPTPTLASTPTATPSAVVISPYITATSSADKKSVFINFWSVSGSKSAIYKLNYKASDVQKEASGNMAFKTGDKQISREIILGVCSGSSCTYDTNVKDIKIEVTFTQNDGATSKITSPHTL